MERFHQAAGSDTVSVGDRVVVHSAASQKALVLNPTGSRIWRLLEVPRSYSDLVEEIVRAQPDVDAQQVAGDVGTYVADLMRLGVVVSE